MRAAEAERQGFEPEAGRGCEEIERNPGSGYRLRATRCGHTSEPAWKMRLALSWRYSSTMTSSSVGSSPPARGETLLSIQGEWTRSSGVGHAD